MPQLMPLYWMVSMIMEIFIIIMLINMYFMKKSLKMIESNNSDLWGDQFYMLFKW